MFEPSHKSSQPAPAPQGKSPLASGPSKSIFSSRTFAGLALIALPLVAQRFGIALSDAATQAIVQDVFQAIGLLVAAWGRIKAARPVHILPPATALVAALALAGCATNTRAGRVTNAVLVGVGTFAGRVALSTVVEIGRQRANGLDLDYAHSAATGLWENMGSIVTSADIERVVAAYTAGETPGLAPRLSAAFEAVGPATPQASATLVAGMAQGITDAALSLQGAEALAK